MSLYDVLKTIAPTYVNSSVQNISNMFDDNEETYARLGLSNQGGNLKIAYEFNEPIDIEEIVLLRRASTSVALNIKDVNNNTIVYGAGTTFPLTGIVSLELVSTANNYVQSDVFIFKVFTRVIYDNKSLISLSDGYKRYEELKYMKISPKMDSNNTPFPFIVSSSSPRSNNTDYYHMFDGNDNTQLIVTGNTLLVQLTLDQKRTLGKYTISHYNNSNGLDPKDWTLEGSNNEVNWYVVDKRFGESFLPNEEKEFTVNSNNPFLYYRINVTNNNGHTSTSIKELVLFEKVESNWKTVSPTLPTLTQFQEEGMDDLSILDRKVQQVIGSPFQMSEEGILGEGKVFKGTVDLKKYFDLRKLEVK